MARLFLTGGAGFIGSAFLKQALADGHDVMVYDNLSFGQRGFAAVGDDRFVTGDIHDGSLLRASIGAFAPDIVVHLAAIHFIPYCNEHPFLSSNINVIGTHRVLQAAGGTPSVRKVFFASTAAVYPAMAGALSEDVAAGPTDIYGLSKFAGEQLCTAFHLETGVPTVIGRFFNAFGPNETNPHLIPAITEQLQAGARVLQLGNTATWRDFIHTSDIAAGVRALLQHDADGCEIFNVGSGREYTAMDVVDAFAKALGKPIEVSADPARTRASDRPHLLADVTKLMTATGWAPTISLQEGVCAMVSEWQ